MSFIVSCECGKKLRVKDELIGKRAKCPVCGAIIRLLAEKIATYDVFVSHSNKDKTVADAICGTLESKGIRCWIAPRDIRAGAEWGASIIDGIEQCRILILVFSSNANLSRQVVREVERAVSKGLQIIPLRIEDVFPSKSLEYFISSQHWLDALTPPFETHLKQLAETVGLLLPAFSKQNDVSTNISPNAMTVPKSGDAACQAIRIASNAIPRVEVGRRLDEAADPITMSDMINEVCGVNSIGNGNLNVKSARRLFESLDVEACRPSLSTSTGCSLGRLACHLNLIAQGIGSPPSVGLEALRKAVLHASSLAGVQSRQRLIQAAEADAMSNIIGEVCGIDSIGSGYLNDTATRTLLEDVVVEACRPNLLPSTGRSLGRLDSNLKFIALRLGGTPCGGLDVLRKAVSDASSRVGVESRQRVVDVADANAMCDLLNEICGIHYSGGGYLNPKAARRLFEGLVVEDCHPALSSSTGTSLITLTKHLSHIAQGIGTPPCAGLHALKNAVSEASSLVGKEASQLLVAADDAKAMSDFIAEMCGVYPYGNGDLNAKAARGLFEGLVVHACRPILSSSDGVSLGILAKHLTHIAQGLGQPPCAGLEAFKNMVSEAINRASV